MKASERAKLEALRDKWRDQAEQMDNSNMDCDWYFKQAIRDKADELDELIMELEE